MNPLILLKSICVLILIGQPWSTIQAASSEQPNIVLIISDDQDNEHLGFMGNPVVRTPNWDRLAEQGTVFTTCHLTASRCRPSLASLLSGRLPHQSGIYANYHKERTGGNNDIDGEKMLDPKNSLPRLLAKAGYATYGSGKYWEGEARAMGFTHGLGQRRRFGEFARKGQAELFSFIDENAGEKPMFVWWAPLMPHTPHNPPKQFLEMFDPGDIPVPDYITRENREEFLKKEHLSLAMEAWTDDEFGKLRAKLEEKGEDANTLYVFLIDNGWCNGLPAKGSVFEKGVRTPVFFSQPGRIPEGVRRKDLISSLDIYPTILSYAGAEVPESAEGKNLREAIETDSPVGRDKLFGAIYPTAGTNNGREPASDVYALYVRTEKWKYVYYTRDIQGAVAGRPFKLHHILAEAPLRRKGDENLFNLDEDPYELRDLSGEAGRQDQLRGFKREVFDWWKRTGGSAIPTETDSSAAPVVDSGVGSKRSRPNILFIASDDLRPELGCYGAGHMKTPNLDRLAASGVRFTNHYVQVATCGASRHALLTSLRPVSEVDYRNGPFKAHARELAARPTESFFHLLKQNGYHTASIGKISHQKWDCSIDLPRSWSEILDQDGAELPSGFDWPESTETKTSRSRRERYPAFAREGGDEVYPDGVNAERVVKAIGRLKNGDKPFAIGVGFIKPHLPFSAPRKYWDLYDPDELPAAAHPDIPAGIDPAISLHPSFELVGQYRRELSDLDSEEYRRHLKHGYCAAVSYMDAQVGKLLDALDENGLSDNTIVMLWGDHGWHLGDHGTWGKHTAFEKALRSPLIVRMPGGAVNRACGAMIESVDIYPTVAAMCDLTPPRGLAGENFSHLLKNPAADGPTEAFGYHVPWASGLKNPPFCKTLRTPRYRFSVWTTVIGSGEIVQVELYDHESDPEESHNLAREQPEIVKSLMTRMSGDGLPWKGRWPKKS